MKFFPTMLKFLFSILIVIYVLVNLSDCCPSVCRCDDRRKIVYCNERSLTQAPYGIPLDTSFLLLQGNQLTNNGTLEPILSKLKLLRRIDLHSNKLTSFPKNLPSSLNYISLRKNSLKFIGRDVFRTLHNLTDLFLDMNNLTSISPGVFGHATSLRRLSLANNHLEFMPTGLSPTLKSLFLAHNNISFVSPSALLTLHNLLLLDLSYNRISDPKLSFDYLQALKTLKLGNNHLQDVPVFLPNNLTDLRLSSNKIRYIYAESSKEHGSFRALNYLNKLDLSSNLLLSVEEEAFSSLPLSASVELQNNMWHCDCNLLYLKTWLTFTTSIVVSSKSTIVCASPDKFDDVTLEAIDADSLSCSTIHLQPQIAEVVDSSSILIEYDSNGNGEPPYVTYSIIYGEMLCNDCSLQGGMTSSSHTLAHLWMKDYTVVPIAAVGLPHEINHLATHTRYVVCVMASYQAPDQVEISQCRDVQTQAPTVVDPPPEPFTTSIPTWVVALAVIILFLLLAVIAGIALRSYIRRSRRSRSFIPGRLRQAPTNGRALNGLPYVDANPDFDFTLVVRPNLKRQSESYQSDSRDESFATSRTGTSASRNSGLETGRQSATHHYEKPLDYNSPAENHNYDRLRLNDRSPHV